MLPNFLVPETVVREAGKGPVLDLEAPGKVLVVTLGITQILEQEGLDITVTGSEDGDKWSPKPLLRFPQKFYCGTYSMVLNLAETPEVKHLRVEYKANRWGRGETQPLFGFYVFAEDAETAPATHRAVA